MKKLIVANWKMNILPSESVDYIKKVDEVKTDNQIIILAPYICLPYLRSNKILFGSQNVFYKNSGSYTGEISPLMLKDIDINYVLIGHYERRTIFKENDSLIELKVKNALSNGLKVIICVNSITTLMGNIKSIKSFENIIVAYEPDDFVGGNTIIEKENIVEFCKNVKELLGDEVKVLYGGGINPNNINVIKTIDILDGIIVGNSSINVDEFIKVIDNY